MDGSSDVKVKRVARVSMSRAIDKTKVFNNVNENYSKRPNASQIDLDGPVED